MKNMIKISILTCVLTSYCSCVLSTGYAESNEFWAQWSDGKAEVNTYTLTQPRYNENRVGQLHLIYVTEPFSKSRHVKVDQYDSKNIDHTIALKLNIVESWRTGVYEYRVMTSQFYDAQDSLTPLKMTFSSQEWCGMSFEEIRWFDGVLKQTSKSYFEGESTQNELAHNVRFIDQLLVIARGLQVGGPQAVKYTSSPFVESAKHRFLSHQPLTSYDANLRLNPSQKINTELGLLNAYVLSFKRVNHSQCHLHIEAAKPYRILAWACDDGEKAHITQSVRMPYWQYTRTQDDRVLEKLGRRKP